ncbi:MAG TPA: DpnI domain-containing protein [Verrucomicrobiae bacterium]|nr:DpnI domain-containing protein [Verrucomicrobiae bacterium]
MTWLELGHPASDYSCPNCRFWYQLKSQKSRIGDSITDGAYRAMMQAIQNDELPSFYFMQYEIIPSLAGAGEGGPDAAGPDEGRGEKPIKSPRPVPRPAQSRGEGMLWRVRNLLLVPHFAFPPSAIIKRKPLSPTARRAGWAAFFHPQTRHKAGAFPGKKETCCNFSLNRIPAEARIFLVRTITSPPRRTGVAPVSILKFSGRNSEVRDRRDACPTVIIPPEEVREQFKRVKPLKEIPVNQRGWTLDVLNIVRRLSLTRPAGHPLPSDGRGTFTTSDAYAFTRELEELHPDNKHIKDKIRQQLQVLRDAGLLLHIGRGEWKLP